MIHCYLYIVLCKNGKYYTGITNDYTKRWKLHQKGRGARYIKANGFDKPVFLQLHPSKSSAMKAEKKLKRKSRQYKECLIESRDNLLKLHPCLWDEKQ